MTICTTCGHENRMGARFCDACGAGLDSAPPREQRKVVTVLFCDVVGSTALGEQVDPEALRALLARYFARMKDIVESHGGTVEKFIGDAVMAVFGVPVVHEDDALRAVRAASEMRAALAELEIGGRIGVNTGEVVTGTEERLATGDAVNVAARLQPAAEPGEVLLGDETRRRVGEAVEVEALEPLTLKGKAGPVRAHRLVRVVGERPSRRTDAPLVGRARERRLLTDAWERAHTERSCRLVTVLGVAGVGKSRLGAEFLGGVADTRIVRGRCLAYGEGITYWPVVEVVKQLGGPEQHELDAAASAPLLSLLREEASPTTPADIAWAFRKLVEAAAPLVVVFDDIHWAEDTFLDLVEHVAVLSHDAPILLLCLARPELLDRRPGWGGTSVMLEPLGADETDELIDRLLLGQRMSPELRTRVHGAAQGNPLFVEEMLALATEGTDDVEVPPTIQALLAARIDGLPRAERRVLECAAVEGKVFHRGAVSALGGDASQLTALVRKGLVRPERAQLAGEDAYRFRHDLIRDAAYDGMSKAERAQLHERFAEWLEERGGLVELDEVLGYHFERAYRLREQLGDVDNSLALRAKERLIAAGLRALDLGAKTLLLERAFAFSPPTASDYTARRELGGAQYNTRGAEVARATYRQAVADAHTPGDAARARLLAAWLLGSSDDPVAVAGLAAEAIPLLEAAGDEAGLATAWRALAWVEGLHGRLGTEATHLLRALEHAQRGGDRLSRVILTQIAGAHTLGPTPVGDALKWIERHLDDARDPYSLHLPLRALLQAMCGRFAEAREDLGAYQSWADERGLATDTWPHVKYEVEMFGGDVAAAERAVRWSLGESLRLGHVGVASTSAAFLAEALYALGRLDEAEHWLGESRRLGAPEDVVTQFAWRQVMAKVMARRGVHDEARRLASEAIAVVEQTDWLRNHGQVLLDAAEVDVMAGCIGDAVRHTAQALELFERKGALVLVERARERLAHLGAAAPTS